MANPLTGEHDAVLQVSASTLNRLLASMHQNDSVPGNVLPTLPHSAFVRVGDDPATRIDKVQGSARVQLGVPQVELIHLAQDRIGMHVWVRARFIRSSGSAPFPEFIYGVLRAEYGLIEVPGIGTPPGPHGRLVTGAYVPPRFRFGVDPASVSFRSEGDTSHDAAITRQILALLKTSFSMPTGHPMLSYLIDKRVLSLSLGGNQAVAIGFELFPGTPATEHPRQIANIVTAGKDWAVAAGREYILSLLAPHLETLKATAITVTVSGPFGVSATYHVKITAATAQWGTDTITSGGTSITYGALDLAIDGKGETSSILPNGTFTIRHRILVIFNAATKSLFLYPKGQAAVDAHFSGIIDGKIATEIRNAYNAQIVNALTAAATQLGATSGFATFLDQQLQLSDAQAASTVDAAEFTNDGVVLRGSVALSPRTLPTVQFDPLPDKTGYGAFLSWWPGGRIVAYHWLWQPDPMSADAVRQSLTDRFVIQPDIPMPGLPPPSGGPPRGGRVCLTIQALVIDPVTGAEVPTVVNPLTGTTVSAFSNDCVSVQLRPPPPWWTTLLVPRLPWHFAADVVVEGAGAGTEPSNTLVYIAGHAEPGSLDTVLRGIAGAERDDAGLVLLTLLPEGALDEATAARIQAVAAGGNAAVHVVEDASGEWARALDAPRGETLRLVTADGRLAWKHDGPLDPGALSAALREHLVAAPAPRFLPLRPQAAIGRPAPDVYLDPVGTARLSLPHLRGRSVTLCFALPGVESSLEQVRRLQHQPAVTSLTAVVLTDGDAAAAVGLDARDLLVVPDPYRTVTDAFGVNAWPTTLRIDENGVVVSVTSGFHPAYERETSA